jgi:hypothetical protein
LDLIGFLSQGKFSLYISLMQLGNITQLDWVYHFTTSYFKVVSDICKQHIWQAGGLSPHERVVGGVDFKFIRGELGNRVRHIFKKRACYWGKNKNNP